MTSKIDDILEAQFIISYHGKNNWKSVDDLPIFERDFLVDRVATQIKRETPKGENEATEGED